MLFLLKLLRKFNTILGWTLIGAISAYIGISIYTFSLVFLPVWILGVRTVPSWMQQIFLYSMLAGFVVGLIKVCALEIIEMVHKMVTLR